jgi:hypothetical protein
MRWATRPSRWKPPQVLCSAHIMPSPAIIRMSAISRTVMPSSNLSWMVRPSSGRRSPFDLCGNFAEKSEGADALNPLHLKTKHMQPLKMLTNVQKARLLHSLLIHEIPQFLGYLNELTEMVLNDKERIKPNGKTSYSAWTFGLNWPKKYSGSWPSMLKNSIKVLRCSLTSYLTATPPFLPHML